MFLYPLSFLKLLLPWSILLLLLLKKHTYRLLRHPLVHFSILFILFNIWIYALTGRPILRYVYVFIPFSFNVVAYVLWQTNEEFPQLITKIFKYSVYVFIGVLIIIIGLPFFIKVPLASVIILSMILVGFIVAYWKVAINQIWMFCLGIILLRIIYAALFIPIQEDHIKVHYRNVAATMARANNGKDITYWSPPERLVYGIDLKSWKWNFDSAIAPPRFMNYMFPYYYYYQSGHIMRYDTVLQPGKTYLTKRELLKDKSFSTLWSWYDVRQKAEFVLFRIK